jgi:hypothetical protein
MKRLILVGKQFSGFGGDDETVTLPELQQLMDQQAVEAVVLGQGLGHEEVEALDVRMREQGAGISYDARDTLAPLALTHKHCASNVLITTPRRVGERRYTAALALNDKMDRLLDHVTGAHLSGMVLIEAGRQLGIASGEIEFDLGARAQPMGFVWSGLDLKFARYAFPVPTELHARIQEHADSSAERPKCTVSISFHQGGEEICTMAMGYELLPKRLLAQIEAKSAKRMVQTLLQAPEPETVVNLRQAYG